MKRTKTQKGITIVSLIITIVILLILSAVAIRGINQDSMITQANNAAAQTKRAQEKKDIKQKVLNWQDLNNNEEQTLREYLGTIYGEDNVKANVDGSVNVILESGNRYKVTAEGQISILYGAEDE